MSLARIWGSVNNVRYFDRSPVLGRSWKYRNSEAYTTVMNACGTGAEEQAVEEHEKREPE